jgi:antitoxin HicB
MAYITGEAKGSSVCARGRSRGVKYRVLIEQDEDGAYVAEVPSLPGCISQGQAREEAVENVREAIAAFLESLEAHGDPIPPPITEEVVEVNV